MKEETKVNKLYCINKKCNGPKTTLETLPYSRFMNKILESFRFKHIKDSNEEILKY